ncbi:ribosomal protein L10e/L16 [Russula aff. rugulosa BPL654]|nr:ribosomal protein L10e/L16 [Russula aff. rugulosa BPL654]
MPFLQSVHSLLSSALRTQCSTAPKYGGPPLVRLRHQLAPRKVTFIKRHKGTTLSFGDWGIRIKGQGVRLTAKQLTTAEEVIKRKIKPIKGARVYMRVFPHIPVCIKGNETRMGKGKGTFEYWAARVPTGRVIFEIGGAPVREELARDALRQAGDKLPTIVEFIDRKTPPRLGSLLLTPEVKERLESSSISTSS